MRDKFTPCHGSRRSRMGAYRVHAAALPPNDSQPHPCLSICRPRHSNAVLGLGLVISYVGNMRRTSRHPEHRTQAEASLRRQPHWYSDPVLNIRCRSPCVACMQHVSLHNLRVRRPPWRQLRRSHTASSVREVVLGHEKAHR